MSSLTHTHTHKYHLTIAQNIALLIQAAGNAVKLNNAGELRVTEL